LEMINMAHLILFVNLTENLQKIMDTILYVFFRLKNWFFLL